MQERLVRSIALLKHQARPVILPGDVGAIGPEPARYGEGGADAQIAADVIVDAAPRVSAHADGRGAALPTVRLGCIAAFASAVLSGPCRAHPMAVEAQHHAYVKQRPIAHR